jgi:hypothetical protein
MGGYTSFVLWVLRFGYTCFAEIHKNIYPFAAAKHPVLSSHAGHRVRRVTGRRVMKGAIPVWREKVAAFGDEKGSVEWSRSMCERYHCSSCGKDVTEELDGTI